MAGVQARSKPNARSAMENDDAEVTCLLAHVLVFFLSAKHR